MDTSILVGPQAEDVDVKARANFLRSAMFTNLCAQRQLMDAQLVVVCVAMPGALYGYWTWGPEHAGLSLLAGLQLTPSTCLATYTCLTVGHARQHTFTLTASESSTVCQPENRCSVLQVALSNSFGFGGHNSCVLFRKFEG